MNLEIVAAEFSPKGNPMTWRIQPVGYLGMSKEHRNRARRKIKKIYGNFIFNEKPILRSK